MTAPARLVGREGGPASLSPAAGATSRPGPRRGRIAALTLLAVVTLYVLRVALWRPLAVAGPEPDDGFVRVPGIVHVHTTLSDGGGTPEEVIRAARAAGLRFLVLTDHNNLDAKPFEGYRDGVLVIVGTELSTTAGHILGLGIPDPGYRFSGDAARRAPRHPRPRRLRGGRAPREPARRPALHGLGPARPLGSGARERRQRVAAGRAAAAAHGGSLRGEPALRPPAHPEPARPDARAVGPACSPRAMWPASRAPTPTAASRSRRRARCACPRYEALFALQRNYALLRAPLTGDFEADRARGPGGPPRRTRLHRPRCAGPGGRVRLRGRGGRRRAPRWANAWRPAPGLRLRAGGRVPEGARVLLLRDGKAIAEDDRVSTVEAPGPGVYRVEVRVPGTDLPWVLTNPIYVHDEATRAARAERAAWPPAEEAPARGRDPRRLRGLDRLRANADARSSVKRELLRTPRGPDGQGAARLEFRIGEPTRRAAPRVRSPGGPHAPRPARPPGPGVLGAGRRRVPLLVPGP